MLTRVDPPSNHFIFRYVSIQPCSAERGIPVFLIRIVGRCRHAAHITPPSSHYSPPCSIRSFSRLMKLSLLSLLVMSTTVGCVSAQVDEPSMCTSQPVS